MGDNTGGGAESAFPRRLRELREAAGLTQAALAEKAGMHAFSVAKLERGEREPSWATVQALAAALGVECMAFQGEPGPPPEPKMGRPSKKAEASAEPVVEDQGGASAQEEEPKGGSKAKGKGTRRKKGG